MNGNEWNLHLALFREVLKGVTAGSCVMGDCEIEWCSALRYHFALGEVLVLIQLHTLDLWNEGQVKVDNVELAQDTARRGEGKESMESIFNGSQDPMDGTGTVYAGEAL